MHIKDFEKVKFLYADREEVLHKIEVCKGKGLGVTIDGRYQSDEIVDVVREALIFRFKKELDEINSKLSEFGINTID